MKFYPYFIHLFFDFGKIRYTKVQKKKRVKHGESRNNWSREGANFLKSVNKITCVCVCVCTVKTYGNKKNTSVKSVYYVTT